MKNLVVYGAGGFGREALVLIGDINQHSQENVYNVLGFVVDKEYWRPNTLINGFPLLGDLDWLEAHKENVCCAIAIGSSRARERVFIELDSRGIEIVTLISPEIYVDPTCKIGRGCYIGYRSLLAPNSTIGNGVFFNTDVMTGHDLTVGDFTTISPRTTISGNCFIGSHVEIGGGSYIIPKRKIGDGAVIAAGSVVFSNVKANTHVMGNPAKRIEL